MENTNSNNVEILSLETITGRRMFPPGLFGIAILFFFFNFCELSCQGTRLAAVSGFAMATGTTIESPKMDNPFGFGAPKEEESKKMPANIWAILALAAAITGASIFLIRNRQEYLIGGIAGAAGVLSLLLLQATITASIEEEGHGMIGVNFLFPYWVSLLALAGGAAVCFLRLKQPGIGQNYVRPMASTAAFRPQNIAQSATFSPPAYQQAPPVAPPVYQQTPPQPIAPPVYQQTPPAAPPIAPPVYEQAPPPPVVSPYPTYQPPVEQPNYYTPPQVVTQQQHLAYQPAPNTSVSPRPRSNSNWLLGLVIGAVVLIGGATVLLEMDLLPGVGASTETGITAFENPKKTSATKPVATPVSSTIPATDGTATLGYVRTLKGSGLNMREKPSDSSAKVMSIPNGSPVLILGYDDHISTLNGETGKWCIIKHNGKIGWAWGKFIVIKKVN